MPALIKPSKISAALQPCAKEGGSALTVSAYLLFDISQPYDLFTEQALWPMVVEQMPDGATFDKGQLKPKAEMIVAGHALAPGYQPVTGLNVTARLNDRVKHLAVFGDRYWRLTDRGIEIVGPAPFDAMPICETRAFGGDGYRLNPKGVGYAPRRQVEAGLDVPLPNVEDASRLILSPEDAPLPAHFGPIGPENPERLKLAGTYDKTWLDQQSPRLPDDFNPLFHCDAPVDQRFDDYFRGGEAFSVTGMNRSGQPVAGQLPHFRVRAFAHHLKEDTLSETGMVCDTATVFPNVGKVVMTFRGLFKSNELFADDIGAVMLAVEHGHASPRPDDYYSHIFRLRTDAEEGYKHALSDHQLLPETDPELRIVKRAERLERAKQERQTFLENSNWLLRKTMDKAGMPTDLLPPPPPDRGQDMPLIGLPTAEEFAHGDFDIAELIEDVETLEKQMNAVADDIFARADMVQQSVDKATPSEISALLPSRPMIGDRKIDPDTLQPGDPVLQSALNALDEVPNSLRDVVDDNLVSAGFPKGLAETNEPREDALARLNELSPSEQKRANDQYELACARALQMPEGSPLFPARQQLQDMRLDVEALPTDLNQPMSVLSKETAADLQLPTLEVSPGEKPPDVDVSASVSAAGRQSDNDTETVAVALSEALEMADDLLGEQLGHLVDDSMSDQPLAGILQTLNDMEFPPSEGQDLPIGDQLEQINEDMQSALDALEPRFAETIAMGRHLSPQALFPQEPLLPGVAVAAGTMVARQLAQGHDFKGADLAGLSLRGVDFSNRDLSGTFFEQADLTGANFKNCKLDGAVFTSARLDNADFEGSRLIDVNFGGARLKNANLDDTTLSQSTLICVDFSGIRARRTRIDTVTFLECTLDDADFTGCQATQMKVTRGSADRLQMHHSNLEAVLFIDLPLGGAGFSACSMRQVVFTQVNAKNADLTATQMFDTGFHGGCDLAAAKFERIEAVDCCWNGAFLEESLYLQANCNSCLFNQCDMQWVDGRAASFKNARFLQTDLKHSDFCAADFFSASLCRTDLRQVSMRHANLFGADLTEAKLASCDLSNANLGNTAMNHAVSANAR